MTDNSNTCANTPRQLIVLCDGTNNTLTGGTHDTNVVKLLEHLRLQPPDPNQIVFYDPGVGSTGSLPAVTVWDQFKQWNQRLMGLAFGGGIFENVAQSYQFLMRNYKTGDQIYLFGFSRGAFTVRCVAGLVNQFGLLEPQMEHMVPSLVQLYFTKRNDSAGAREVVGVTKQIKDSFVSEGQRQVDIQYVGVWDTVASVGFGPLKTTMTTKPTIQGKCFLNVRHAMSLDEQRAQFKVRLYSDDNDTSGKYQTASSKPASLIQQWFPGCHCDVGGGNPEPQSTLSNIALDWLVNEAISCGLRLAPSQASGKAAPEAHPIQSQTYVTPLWALTGLHVRDTTKAEIDGGKVFPVAPVAHKNAFYNSLQFPVSTFWATHRPFTPLVIALALIVGFYFWMDEILNGGNNALASWQLTWWRGGLFTTDDDDWLAVRCALLLDFGFIAAYTYVLARMATRAFATIAGLNHVGPPTKKWLNRLGWALPLMVFADVLENVATAIFLGWLRPSLADDTVYLALNYLATYVVGIAMSIFSTLKWLGLGGVGVLVIWSWTTSLVSTKEKHHV